MRQAKRALASSGRSASALAAAPGSDARMAATFSRSGCSMRPWQYFSSSLTAVVMTAFRSLQTT